MDGKGLLFRLTLIMAVMVGYMYFVEYEYKKNPQWTQQTQTPPAQTGGNSSTNPTTAGARTNPGTIEASSQPTTSPSGWQVLTHAAPSPWIVGSTKFSDQTFSMGVATNSLGASIDSVTLT